MGNTNTGPRASALVLDALPWLEESDRFDHLDEDLSSLEIGLADKIRGADADVIVGIATITGSSSRRNLREERTIVLEVEVAVTTDWVKRHGTLGHLRVLDAISDELTTHRDGWRAEGESGGMGPVEPGDDRDRYLGVRRYDFGRID